VPLWSERNGPVCVVTDDTDPGAALFGIGLLGPIARMWEAYKASADKRARFFNTDEGPVIETGPSCSVPSSSPTGRCARLGQAEVFFYLGKRLVQDADHKVDLVLVNGQRWANAD